MAGERIFTGCPANISNYMTTTTTSSINLLHNPPPTSQPPLNSLFLPISPSFFGSRSMVMSFEDVKGTKRSFFSAAYDESGEDEYLYQGEKKRRLSADQVEFLEKSFEVENKLEPERKTKIAKDLGLQPRQVAIWFQNRRARWKSKQLEKDYESLNHSYESLKTAYDNILEEKERLKAEVASLTEKVIGREKLQKVKFNDQGESHDQTKGLLRELQQKTNLLESISEGEGSKVCISSNNKQEDITSSASDILDSESPRYTDGALLETGDSSYAFEPDQSDLSQDEEDSLLPDPYMFTKVEDHHHHHHVNYSDQPQSSCNFGFHEEDPSLWPWSY